MEHVLVLHSCDENIWEKNDEPGKGSPEDIWWVRKRVCTNTDDESEKGSPQGLNPYVEEQRSWKREYHQIFFWQFGTVKLVQGGQCFFFFVNNFNNAGCGWLNNYIVKFSLNNYMNSNIFQLIHDIENCHEVELNHHYIEINVNMLISHHKLEIWSLR